MAIICVQCYVFYGTYGQIKSIAHFLRSERSVKLGTVSVPLEETSSDDDEASSDAEAEASSMPLTVSVILVRNDSKNELLCNVVGTINRYLRKNKGAAADFHLIKDIVERHCDTIDEEIGHKLPVPIYLGLMGTVVGIIIGLWSLDFQFNPETSALNGELFVQSVSGLISGVKSAMICSLVGLGMTTVLSSWLYRGAKTKLEAQKNMFYDFIQTHLLPQLSRDASSTILALQANLERFNESFEKNIDNFSYIMDDIHNSFESQAKLQQELKNTDLSQVANLNANTLMQLRNSMGEFEKFTRYLGQMNTFVHHTAQLTDSINDQLERTEAVKTVVDSLQDNIKKNEHVMMKLREFLERIDENHAVITAAGEIDSTMTQAITELRMHTQEQINSIKAYTSEATADLRELVSAERGHLKSLDNLKSLSSLDRLLEAINDMRLDNKAAMGVLQSRIETMSNIMSKSRVAEHGQSVNTPSWLRTSCIVLFVVTCLCVIACTLKVVFSDDDSAPATTYINSAPADSASRTPTDAYPMSAEAPTATTEGQQEDVKDNEKSEADAVKVTTTSSSKKKKTSRRRRRG